MAAPGCLLWFHFLPGHSPSLWSCRSEEGACLGFSYPCRADHDELLKNKWKTWVSTPIQRTSSSEGAPHSLAFVRVGSASRPAPWAWDPAGTLGFLTLVVQGWVVVVVGIYIWRVFLDALSELTQGINEKGQGPHSPTVAHLHVQWEFSRWAFLHCFYQWKVFNKSFRVGLEVLRSLGSRGLSELWVSMFLGWMLPKPQTWKHLIILEPTRHFISQIDDFHQSGQFGPFNWIWGL